jgi:hypothetical protein
MQHKFALKEILDNIPQNVEQQQIEPLICYEIQTAYVVVLVKWGMAGGVVDISNTHIYYV